MRLAVEHETLYTYTSPFFYSIQQLRLTPRAESHQRALSWEIDAPAPLESAIDAYGNTLSTLAIARAGSAIRVKARGVVDIDPLIDGRVMEPPGATTSPLIFIAPTSYTWPDDHVIALAHDTGVARASVDTLLALAGAVSGAVEYRSGVTDVMSTASQALAMGNGVCQDHAHVFIAAARTAGVPCRYVSGYLYPGERPELASHAWIDAWVDDAGASGGAGWISIDVTHRCFASERYVRLAVGRDYETAAPIRGVRTGGGDEHMKVTVSVTPV